MFIIACLLSALLPPVPPAHATAGMLVKVGSFAKPNATTGNQAVTGVGFQPKLVMFFGTYNTADGTVVGAQEYFGAAVSSTKRAAIGDAVLDNALNHGSKRFSNALVITQMTPNNATPTVLAEADFVSMDADGFTINWTTCDATQRIVNFIALAGDDLTNVDVGSFTAPTSASDKAVTGVGFQPDALIIFDNAVTTTPVAVGSSKNPSFNMGFVVGTTQQGNRTTTRASDEAAGNWMYQSTATAENSVDKTGAVVRTAAIKSMDADGFTMTFNPAAANAVYLSYIALKGGQYKTGSFNQATVTGNQSVTGVGFQPAGVLFQSSNTGASLTAVTNSRLSFGVGVSDGVTASGTSIWTGVTNGLTAVADSDLDRTKCLKMLTEGTPTLNAAMSFVSNDADGFTVNNTTVDTTSRQILYFAFGEAADTTPPAPSGFSPASAATVWDTTQTITFTTDENATCKVSLTDQAYADMSVECTGGGTTSQSCTTPDLGSDGAKTVYVACTDGTNADTADTNEHLSYTLDTDSSLILYHFENDAGVVNSGVGGATYDGTFAGNAAYSATAKVGSYGAAFDRTADYVDVGWGSGVNPRNQSFSAMFWVQESVACPSGTDNHIFGAGDAGAGTRWYIRCRANTWRYRVGGLTEVNTAIGVTLNTWYHIALVGNADTDTAKLYINGTERGSVNMTADFSLIGNLFIGNFNDNSGTFAEGSNGIFDEFSLYTRVLTADEILAAYNAPDIPNVPTGLAATPYDGRVKLAWTAPTPTDQAVTDYKVEYKEDADVDYATFAHAASAETSIFVTGLTNTTAYDFRISAVNAAGTGSVTDTVSATPYAMMAYDGTTPADAATLTGSSLTVSVASTVQSGSTFTFDLRQNGDVMETATSPRRTGDYNTDNLVETQAATNLALSTNTSGVAYVPASDTIFVVHNDPPKIDELTLTGALIRSITCSGNCVSPAADSEGIEWIGSAATTGGYNHTFMVSTERLSRLYRVVIGPNTATFDTTDTFPLYVNGVALGDQGNSGLEGIAYDAAHDLYYSVKEITPMKVYFIRLGHGSGAVTEICNAPTLLNGVVTDLADIDYDATTGHLYLLSHESEKVVTVDISNLSSCSVVRTMSVADMTQAEGMSWDDRGEYLYIAGEADELSVYRTTNYSAAHTFTGIADGVYTYTVTMTDVSGVDTVTASRTVTISATPPVPSSFSPASASTITDATPTITFSLNENGDCKISLTDQSYDAMAGDCSGDGTQSISCTAPDLGTDGAKTVYIACKDTGGAEDSADTNEALSYTLDTTVPVPSAFSPASTSTITDATPTITFSLNENGDCKVSLTDQAYGDMAGDCSGDGTQSMSCTSPDLGGNGAKTVYVACSDTAGNADSIATNEALAYTLDSAVPTLSSFSPASLSVIADTTPTVTFSLNENGDCKVSLTDQAYGDMAGDCSGDGTQSISCTVPDLGEDGSKTVYLACSDTAGNAHTVNTNVALTYDLDTTVPGMMMISPSPGTTVTDATPTISLVMEEEVDCKVSLTDQAYGDMATDCTGDGTAEITCPSPDLGEDGAKTVYVSCKDSLGNEDTAATNEELSFTLDTTVPAPSSFSPVSASTITDATPTVTFSLNENGNCKISLTDQAYGDMAGDCTGDGTQSISCTAPDLGTDGAKTVYVACRDTAGNADTAGTNESLSYSLDTTAPSPSNFSPASSSTITDATPTITFTVDEAASCRASTDDESYDGMGNGANCDEEGLDVTCTLPGLGADGAKTVYVACSDTAGNEDTADTSETLSYTLDTATHNSSSSSSSSSSESSSAAPSAGGSRGHGTGAASVRQQASDSSHGAAAGKASPSSPKPAAPPTAAQSAASSRASARAAASSAASSRASARSSASAAASSRKAASSSSASSKKPAAPPATPTILSPLDIRLRIRCLLIPASRRGRVPPCAGR